MKLYFMCDKIQVGMEMTGVRLMRYGQKSHFIKTVSVCLTAVLLWNAGFTVQATKIGDMENQIQDDKNALGDIKDQISGLEDEQDILEEEISDLDAELLNTMTSVGLLEDDIAQKKTEIATAEKEYEEAKKKEEEQYEAMVIRIQYMYENGEQSYLSILLEAGSLSEFLNRADYVCSIYEYDRKFLKEYEESKKLVEKLWNKLVDEKAELEKQTEELKEQSACLEQLLAEKKKASDNYEAQIAKAKQEAAIYKTKIRQEEKELKKLKEEERRKNAANNIGNINVTKFDVSIIDNAPGSDLGKKIAKYGCQFIGNPYVMGGTSLTKGTDCSGFTYRIYKDFGYNIDRTSTQQRSNGVAVAQGSEQPGDIICYSGHVGLYVGGGYIVHASSRKTGIKISKMGYRPILAIRRII